MKVDWIFFDIGNVLCQLDFESVWNGFIEKCGIGIDRIKEALYNEYLFNGFECGKIQPEEYYRGVKKIIGCNITYQQFVEIWNSIVVKNDRMFNLAKRLKERFNILILSNTNVLNAFVIDADIKEISNKVIYSYEVGYMKPDPEIFNFALHQANTLPENVLFIDDLLENILAAEHLRFNTFLFNKIENFESYIIDEIL